MNNRPHSRKLTRELIAAVDHAKNDADALVALIHEIELRKKSKANLASTLERARKLLDDARNNAARGNATKDMEKFLDKNSAASEGRPGESPSTGAVFQPNEMAQPVSSLRCSWLTSIRIG